MKLRIGFAICASFCTFSKAIEQMKILKKSGHKILPIMSKNAYNTDTKFGESKKHIFKIENICKKEILVELTQVEPIGPKDMIDIMLIAPCTSNTLNKLANGITDNVVTLAVKSHLRKLKPVLIAFASNDALGASAQNMGKMLNTKNIYFVPMLQDDSKNKPNSLVANFDLIPKSIELAIEGKQIRPVFIY